MRNECHRLTNDKRQRSSGISSRDHSIELCVEIVVEYIGEVFMICGSSTYDSSGLSSSFEKPQRNRVRCADAAAAVCHSCCYVLNARRAPCCITNPHKYTDTHTEYDAMFVCNSIRSERASAHIHLCWGVWGKVKDVHNV